MTHGELNTTAPQKHVFAVDPDEHANHEQRTLPLICGEAAVPLRWIGQVYDQFTKDAPVERPGKK